jgi:hypothetical protein
MALQKVSALRGKKDHKKEEREVVIIAVLADGWMGG